MGRIRTDTLNDLAKAGIRLLLSCPSCGHKREIPAAQLAMDAPSNQYWWNLRFGCTACGQKGIRLIRNGETTTAPQRRWP